MQEAIAVTRTVGWIGGPKLGYQIPVATLYEMQPLYYTLVRWILGLVRRGLIIMQIIAVLFMSMRLGSN